MTRLARSALSIPLVLGLVLIASCRADPPPVPPEEPAPEVRPDPEGEVTEAPNEELAEIREHSLIMDEVRRYERAAEAVHRAVIEDPQVPGLEDLEAQLARAGSMEEVQQILDQHPRVQQALSDAGLSSRDYVLTGTALLGAYSYILMREQGIPDAYRPDYVTDEHIRFVEQNRAEVDSIVERLQAIYGADDGF